MFSPLSFFYGPPDDIGFTLLSGPPDDRINTSTFGPKFYCHIFEWKNVVNQKRTTDGTVTNTYCTMYEIMNRPDGDFSKRLFPPSLTPSVSTVFAPRKKPVVVSVHRVPGGPEYTRKVVSGWHAWLLVYRRKIVTAAAAAVEKNKNKQKNKNENAGVWRGGSRAGGFCRISILLLYTYMCVCVCVMALVTHFRRGVTADW